MGGAPVWEDSQIGCGKIVRNFRVLDVFEYLDNPVLPCEPVNYVLVWLEGAIGFSGYYQLVEDGNKNILRPIILGNVAKNGW